MKIKSLLFIITTCVLAMGLNAGVPIPTGEPAFVLKTRAGSAEKETNRNMSLYFKTYTANQKVYIQWGDSIEAQELNIPKANTIVSTTFRNLPKPDMEVKIWCNDLNFFNCIRDSIYGIKVGTDGKRVKELRISVNPIKDFSFIDQIDSLFYLVLDNNRYLTNLDLKNPKLGRLDLGTSNELATLNLNCPELYDIKISGAKLLKNLDLSRCPLMQTLNALQVSGLESFDLGAATKLKTIQITGNADIPSKIKSMKFENLPSLTDLTVMNFVDLEKVEVGIFPELTKLYIYRCGLTTFNVPEMPKLTTLIFSNHDKLTDVTISAKNITSLQLDYLTSLKEVDLTSQKALKTVNIRNGGLEKIKYDPESWQANVTSMSVINNHLSFTNIPFKPKKFTLTTNYYAPQANPKLPRSITIDEVLDLSEWSTANNGETSATTEFKWTTKFGEELTENKDFTLNEGKIKFLHEIDDSVCFEPLNAIFPKFERTVNPKTGEVTDYRLISNCVKVNASQSGIEDVAGDVKDDVKVQGRMFMAAGKKVLTVFDAQGRKIGAGKAVEVSSPGLYIAKCGKKAIKAMIK